MGRLKRVLAHDAGGIMSPMVQHQQRETNRQRQTKDGDSETEDDSCDAIRHHRSRRPLYRRFFNYVREAWTGVKFALGNTYKAVEISSVSFYLLTLNFRY